MLSNIIKASAILNPDVNEVLLSYYREACTMVNLTDKKIVVFEPSMPSDMDSFDFNTPNCIAETKRTSPVMGKILPFVPRVDSSKN